MYNNNNSIYINIFNQYKKYIELGVYKQGDKLPSVRMLAEELGINPNTVQRAYQLLEDNQYIETILKKGVYVKYNQNDNLKKYNNIKQDLLKIKEANITKEELVKLIEEVYND